MLFSDGMFNSRNVEFHIAAVRTPALVSHSRLTTHDSRLTIPNSHLLQMKTSFYFLLLLLLITACKKSAEIFDPNAKAPLIIEFDNVAGEQDLEMNTGNYINASGDTFSVNSLHYFISNISLINSNGVTYTLPKDSSYFLINENTDETETLINVPEGEYRSLSFTVGIDSLRSSSGPGVSGVLAPTPTTYRNENEGYIFLDLEGSSPQAPGNEFRFQIGGYGGKSAPTINNIKTVTIDLSKAGVAKVHSGHTSEIHLMADILKVFTGAANITLSENNIVLFDPFSVNIANNYQNMFRHDHTHN
jgi:hypothetical protein